MCPNKLTERLKEEIEALKGGVTAAADHLKKSRNTIYNWFEKGNAPVDQVEKLVGIGVDTGYVFTGIRTSEFKIRLGASGSDKINEKSLTYNNSDADSVTRTRRPSSGEEVGRNKLDNRLAAVIDDYIRDDILTMIVTTLDQVLNEKGVTLDDDTKARLIGAAEDGYEQLTVGGRTEKFSDLLLALVDATLAETDI